MIGLALALVMGVTTTKVVTATKVITAAGGDLILPNHSGTPPWRGREDCRAPAGAGEVHGRGRRRGAEFVIIALVIFMIVKDLMKEAATEKR